MASPLKKQPPFGWRQTELQKQLFVCRPVEKPWPNREFQVAARDAFREMGAVATQLATELLKELNWSAEAIADLLRDSVPVSCALDDEVNVTFVYDSISDLFSHNKGSISVND